MKIFNLKLHITNPSTSPRLPSSLKFRRTRRRAEVVSPAFTIIEILIIAPIVILVIGIFITVIVNMTGDVLSTRGANVLAFNIQNSLDSIQRDVKLSGAFLATNNITLTSPQGYGDDTTNFHNADATNGTMLILNSYTTNINPTASNRNIVYAHDQPNACNSAQISQNDPLMMNTIYFVKSNTLWRRVIAPSFYATVGCSVPWQQPSCAPTASGAFCKTQDIRLVDGIQTGGFSVSYYTSIDSTTANTTASDSSQTDTARLAALQTTNTIVITINATNVISGRTINQTGTIRAVSPNNNIAATTGS